MFLSSHCLIHITYIIYNFQTSDGTLVTWEVLSLERGDVMQSATKTVSQGVKGRGYDSIGVLLLFACEVRRNGRSSITLRCKVSLSLLEVGYSINEFLLILLASFATLCSGLFCTIHCIKMTWWADGLMGWWVLPKFAPVLKEAKKQTVATTGEVCKWNNVSRTFIHVSQMLNNPQQIWTTMHQCNYWSSIWAMLL